MGIDKKIVKKLKTFDWEFLTSKNLRIDGTIKDKPEDFIVEEIFNDGTLIDIEGKVNKINLCEKNGKYTYFVLIKRDWPTDMALKAIAKKLKVSHKRFTYAGTKDKKALTSQLCCAYQIDEKFFNNLQIKDIKTKAICKGNTKINLGMLKGNKFTIKINNLKGNIKDVEKELKGLFPNYYGVQRFGSNRRNTHIIGYLILKGHFENAALMFLTDHEGEENKASIEAREKLKNELDFRKALSYFPKYLKHERLMLHHLAKHPKDYVNAFRRIPRHTILLFIHSLQSYIFNTELSIRIKENILQPLENETTIGIDKDGFPSEKHDGDLVLSNIVGYETFLNPIQEEILDELNLRKEEFKIKSFPELSSKGSKRLLLSPYINFKIKNNIIEFMLPAGSYATAFLREFFKRNV